MLASEMHPCDEKRSEPKIERGVSQEHYPRALSQHLSLTTAAKTTTLNGNEASAFEAHILPIFKSGFFRTRHPSKPSGRGSPESARPRGQGGHQFLQECKSTRTLRTEVLQGAAARRAAAGGGEGVLLAGPGQLVAAAFHKSGAHSARNRRSLSRGYPASPTQKQENLKCLCIIASKRHKHPRSSNRYSKHKQARQEDSICICIFDSSSSASSCNSQELRVAPATGLRRSALCYRRGSERSVGRARRPRRPFRVVLAENQAGRRRNTILHRIHRTTTITAGAATKCHFCSASMTLSGAFTCPLMMEWTNSTESTLS